MADYNAKNARTLFCGNLSNEATEEIIYELFLQAGPIECVNIPKDPKSGRSRSFGFITFKHECSVPYAMELYNGETLFKRPLLIQSRTSTTMESPSSHYSPQTPLNNSIDYNIMGNGSPHFTPRSLLGLPPILYNPSELIVLDDDCSPQNHQRERHRHGDDGGGVSGNRAQNKSRHQNYSDDVFLIDNDQPRQNNGQQIPRHSNYGNNNRNQQQYQSPSIRMDSMMKNPWEQLEDNSPNTSRHHQRQHHRQHRNYSPYENRRRY